MPETRSVVQSKGCLIMYKAVSGDTAKLLIVASSGMGLGLINFKTFFFSPRGCAALGSDRSWTEVMY